MRGRGFVVRNLPMGCDPAGSPTSAPMPCSGPRLVALDLGALTWSWWVWTRALLWYTVARWLHGNSWRQTHRGGGKTGGTDAGGGEYIRG